VLITTHIAPPFEPVDAIKPYSFIAELDEDFFCGHPRGLECRIEAIRATLDDKTPHHIFHSWEKNCR
jgi:hypothetical protein